MLKCSKKLNIKLLWNIGIKVHYGERGNKNFIRTEFFKPIVDYLDGIIIDTNSSDGVIQYRQEQEQKII